MRGIIGVELIIFAILVVGGGIALVGGMKMIFTSRKDVSAEPNESKHRQNRNEKQSNLHDEANTQWRELDIEWRHPGSDWVYLPKFDKDNECKLVTIRDLGHREAVEPLIQRVLEKRDYTLSLEREPTNKHDPNAIQVMDTTGGSGVVVGYLPKEVSAVIANRYSTNMPISVIVKRATKAPDGAVYLRLAPLVPKKSLRKQYELA